MMKTPLQKPGAVRGGPETKGNFLWNILLPQLALQMAHWLSVYYAMSVTRHSSKHSCVKVKNGRCGQTYRRYGFVDELPVP